MRDFFQFKIAKNLSRYLSINSPAIRCSKNSVKVRSINTNPEIIQIRDLGNEMLNYNPWENLFNLISKKCTTLLDLFVHC